MKTKKVLIVSHDKDGSARLIMQRLSEIGEMPELIDLGAFRSNSVASIDYSSGRIAYRDKSAEFDGSSVKSIWWRRPKGKIRNTTRNPIDRYIEFETEIFTGGLFGLLKDALFFNERSYKRA